MKAHRLIAVVSGVLVVGCEQGVNIAEGGTDESVRGTAEGDVDPGLKIGADVEQALAALPNALAVPGSAGAPSFVYGDLGSVSD